LTHCADAYAIFSPIAYASHWRNVEGGALIKGREPVGQDTTIVRDAWAVRCQAYGTPSRPQSIIALGEYQIILLRD